MLDGKGECEMKRLLLVILLISLLILCSPCATDQQLGYRQYPYVSINPSRMGQIMRLYIPPDKNDYIYHSCDFENTEIGIDMIIHFAKKGEL